MTQVPPQLPPINFGANEIITLTLTGLTLIYFLIQLLLVQYVLEDIQEASFAAQKRPLMTPRRLVDIYTQFAQATFLILILRFLSIFLFWSAIAFITLDGLPRALEGMVSLFFPDKGMGLSLLLGYSGLFLAARWSLPRHKKLKRAKTDQETNNDEEDAPES